jgi:aldehyde dehydrogenase (NAD+)
MGSAADVDRAVSGSSPHWLPPKWAPHRPLTAAKVAPALAAGNTVVLKPSEAAPFTTRAPAEIIADAGLPAGAFNLVSGDGPVVGHRIAAHPDVGLVSFTGSTAAGVQVSIAAAESIIAATVERFEVGDPTAESTTHGPLVSELQRDRVVEHIRSGITEGAKLLVGGPEAPASLSRGYYVRPTVFTRWRPTPGSSARRSSARSWWSRCTRPSRRPWSWPTPPSTACPQASGRPNAPFGGYKRSGVGREYGRYGLEEFQEIKSSRLP